MWADIGWGFFILITIAAYTANLAAFLTSSPTGFYYASLDMVIERQAVVCVAAAVADDVRIAYPQANVRVVSFSGDLAQSYVDNGCDAVVWSMNVVMREPATLPLLKRFTFSPRS